MVAGEDAEAAGVLRQRLGQSELGGEVGDHVERAVGAPLEPARLGGGLGQALGGGVGQCGNLRVRRQLGPPPGGDPGDQSEWIVPARLPQGRIQLGEQGLRLAVPRPVDVVGQRSECGETRRDRGDDIELADCTHSGSLVGRGPRPNWMPPDAR